jgi:uncharacterized phage protein (TIGR01671 family)
MIALIAIPKMSTHTLARNVARNSQCVVIKPGGSITLKRFVEKQQRKRLKIFKIGESMEDRYLFKAKRIDNGEWAQGNLIQSCDATDGWETIIIPTKNSNMFTQHIKRGYGNLGFENWYRVNPSTVCQCTGLKDKNGKLIWENDIMVAHLDEDYPEDETYIKIIWHGNGFYVMERGGKDITLISKSDQEYFEVCGNIFDNPELLGRNGE